MRICCPSTSSSCSQSRPLSGTAAPSHSKPSDNFHLVLQRETTARIWVFLCLPKSHSLLGGHIWAPKRSGRDEGGAEGLLQHHHPLGALRDLWCRFRFTTLIFCCLIKGVKLFPPFLDSSPGAGEEGATSRGRARQLPQPLQRDLGAEPSVSQRILLPEALEECQKTGASLPPRAPKLTEEVFGVFLEVFGFFLEVFCLRTCSSGSADGARGGQLHLRVLQEDSKCTRRVPRG